MSITYLNGEPLEKLDLSGSLTNGTAHHDLSPDITGSTIVIDDLTPDHHSIEPYAYELQLSGDMNRYEIFRVEMSKSRHTKREFVCSFSDIEGARSYCYKLNARHLQLVTVLESRLLNSLEFMAAGEMPHHSVIISILALTAYDQHQEFQSLISEYDQYLNLNLTIPFTLSACFNELMRDNRLAVIYAELDDILSTASTETDLDELARTLIIAVTEL